MANYITKKGFDRLNKKLQQLIKERPAIIKQVQTAREMGDLSENAEYHAARENQKHLENEFNKLKRIMQTTKVLDVDKIAKDVVRFGAFVKIFEIAKEEEHQYQIVGQDETFDYEDGIERISVTSPIGRAIIGKKVNEEFVVKAPIGDRIFKILEIK
ncbi:MAG: transcription elongation factor GreA [Candidatus Cloacimonadota bacterium]|nr:transcription elongation factor GreA [Candidatus Cloacimonadota bacterium]